MRVDPTAMSSTLPQRESLRRALSDLSGRLDDSNPDDLTRRLVGGWLTGGYMAVERCIDAPGPLSSAWARAGERALVELILEFTFPMMSRWFRYIKGAEAGLPASRVRKRVYWIEYLVSTLCQTTVEKRAAIQTRLDALFNRECEANTQAGASPGLMGLTPPGSLSPAQAADLANRNMDGFHRASWARLGMSVVKGQVSVLEPYYLGLRALGLCGRLDRYAPMWDQPIFVPVRPASPAAAPVPATVWSISAALLLVHPLDVGMESMFQRLRSFAPDSVQAPSHRPDPRS